MATRQTFAYTPFQYDKYTKSDEVLAAEQKKANAEQAVAEYGDFLYRNQTAYDDVMNKILNREKFSYDLNGDALYQQYKDKYTQEGKMASANVMGQAAAMTGGYGNSYAASVGNQAYQASLQNLNDIIPELYQMAYDRYNQEGQDLYNQYGMLSNDRSTEYGMWGDKRNALMADRDYYSNDYNNAYNRDYGMYIDDRNLAHSEHTTSEGYKYQNVADANSWAQWEANYNESVRQYNESMTYQKERDAVADSQWQQQFNLASTPSSPSLSASEFNTVMENAANYANMGKDALSNYLRGMMSRGLSESEALNIYSQYFPATQVPDPPEKEKDTKRHGGAGGSNGRLEIHLKD
jgi:hypothetical protein